MARSARSEKDREWLGPEGRACFVYPEKRRADFLVSADASGLTVKRLRFVHPRAGEPPNLFLIELERAAGIRRQAGEKQEERRIRNVKDETGIQPEMMSPLILFAPTASTRSRGRLYRP
jgi:tRNA1(Val) A37 N6-methylase TrmN6